MGEQTVNSGKKGGNKILKKIEWNVLKKDILWIFNKKRNEGQMKIRNSTNSWS